MALSPRITSTRRTAGWAASAVLALVTALAITPVATAEASAPQVSKAIVVEAAAPISTTVGVWRSQSSQTYGSTKTTTFKIAVKTSGTKIPTGVVAVRSNGKPLARIALDSKGKATYVVPSTAGTGHRKFQVVYEPQTSSFKTSKSSTIKLDIFKATPKVSVSITPSVIPYSKQGNAAVSVKVTGAKATGVVALKYGPDVISSAKLNASGKANLKTAAAAGVGTTNYTLIYVGTNRIKRVEKVIGANVRKVTPSVSLTLSKGSATTAQAVTAHVKVTSSAKIIGSVKIKVGANYYGPTTLVNGRAAITIPAGQAAGVTSVKAQYLSSPNFNTAYSTQRSINYTKPANPCPVTSDACVDLTNELAWLQSNGQIVYGPVPMTAGRAGHRTNVGTFSVFWKHKDHKSSIFNDAPMPNSVFFDGGIAFHQGSVYQQSHGCIHLTWNDSEYFYNFLSVGDRVSVFGTDPY